MIYFMTSGEYSDYSIDGIYEGPEGLDDDVLKRLSIIYLKDPVNEPYPGAWEGLRTQVDEEKFNEWLAKEYGLKKLDSQELRTTRYGRIDIDEEELL